MSEPTCETCRFWKCDNPEDGDDRRGECRRNAPRPRVLTADEYDRQQATECDEMFLRNATTNWANWCGEHQPRKAE